MLFTLNVLQGTQVFQRNTLTESVTPDVIYTECIAFPAEASANDLNHELHNS